MPALWQCNSVTWNHYVSHIWYSRYREFNWQCSFMTEADRVERRKVKFSSKSTGWAVALTSESRDREKSLSWPAASARKIENIKDSKKPPFRLQTLLSLGSISRYHVLIVVSDRPVSHSVSNSIEKGRDWFIIYFFLPSWAGNFWFN